MDLVITGLVVAWIIVLAVAMQSWRTRRRLGSVEAIAPMDHLQRHLARGRRKVRRAEVASRNAIGRDEKGAKR